MNPIPNLRLSIIELSVPDPEAAAAAVRVAVHLDNHPTTVVVNGHVLSVVTYYDGTRWDAGDGRRTLHQMTDASASRIVYDGWVGDE